MSGHAEYFHRPGEPHYHPDVEMLYEEAQARQLKELRHRFMRDTLVCEHRVCPDCGASVDRRWPGFWKMLCSWEVFTCSGCSKAHWVHMDTGA